MSKLLSWAAALFLLVAASMAAAANLTPLTPFSKEKPKACFLVKQTVGAIKNKIAVGNWKTSQNADGSTSYVPESSGRGLEHATYTEKKDGTIRISYRFSKITYVIIDCYPNGDVSEQLQPADGPFDPNRETTVWHADGTITVTETDVRKMVTKNGTETTTVTTETVIKTDGSTTTTKTTTKPDGTATTETGSTPPTKTAATTPGQPGTPIQGATAPTLAAPTTPAPPPSTTPAPPPPPTPPAHASAFGSSPILTAGNFQLGVDAFILPLRRDVVFDTPSFAMGGMVFPGNSSTITHRTTGFAPMLDASYDTPIWLANAPQDFAFGGRFGGYVTGNEREDEFSTRISTSGSFILNPYVQYRPRVANLWTLFFEAGAWIEDDCFSERDLIIDTRTSLHGFSAAPELGVGVSTPVPWANVGDLEFHGGLHWIGSSSISEQTPFLPGVDQTIRLERRDTIAIDLGLKLRF